MSSRVRGEAGYAVPLVISVIAIVTAFSAVAVVLATHNVDRSTRDRSAIRALAAAEAGLDAAAYRMSKAVIASRVDGLLSAGTLTALVQETAGCLDLGVGDLSVELLTPANCTSGATEDVDAPVDDDGVGEPASFRYWVKLRANVLVSGRSLVERQIVSVGETGGVVKRLSGVYRLNLAAPTTALFKRVSLVECSAEAPAGGANPAAGCSN